MMPFVFSIPVGQSKEKAMRWTESKSERSLSCTHENNTQIAAWKVELLPKGSDDTAEDGSRAITQAASPLDTVVVSELQCVEVSKCCVRK